jgi:hypothetical protein
MNFVNVFINILIVVFSLFLVFSFLETKPFYGIFNKKNIIEGLDKYQDYNQNNVFILAQKNAANIQVLKENVDQLQGVKSKVDEHTKSIEQLTSQLNQIMMQQGLFAQSKLPNAPLNVSGIKYDSLIPSGKN